jgi:hypothetical protein
VTTCPKCGFEADGSSECVRCGVVYARWRAPAVEEAPLPVMAEAEESPVIGRERSEPAPSRIDRLGWAAFGGGLAAALVALQFPLAEAALSGMKTLVHEMGHAAFGWLFGYPSIPAFDFSYGGGVTLQHERSVLLGALVVAAAAYGAFALRAHALLRNSLLVFLALYAPLALTRGHEVVILAMGHGGELCFATLAFHRALSGRGCTLAAERPLYGLLGWFLVLGDVVFAWRLRTSAFHRELYEAAKGGGHWMDFSRLAEEFLHVPLESVATGFVALCLAPPVLALALQRLRRD